MSSCSGHAEGEGGQGERLVCWGQTSGLEKAPADNVITSIGANSILSLRVKVH